MAFKMVCEKLKISLIVRVFFFLFYATRPMKGDYVSLGSLPGRDPFTFHSNQYKNWRDKFARMRGQKGFLVVLGMMTPPLSFILNG